MADGEVSTIFVAGLPMDATYRELENMVRFFPGYEAFKVSNSKGGKGGSNAMFVKFDSGSMANQASKVLNAIPFDTSFPDIVMRVEIARSDMKSPAAAGGSSGPGQGYQPAPSGFGGRGAHVGLHYPAMHGQPPPPNSAPPMFGYGGAGWDEPPRKRARGGEPHGEVDTIVLLGQVEKGFSKRQLEDFFIGVPGFVAFRSNARVGGGFVKFANPGLAQDAIGHASENGIEAQMARTSMSTTDSDSAGGDEPRGGYGGKGGGYDAPRGKGYDGGHGGKGHGPPSTSRRHESPGSVDTLVLLGQVEKGFSERQLEEFFSAVQGFVAWKPNSRVGGGFVKFASPQYAQEAIEAASSNGIEAQMARSSMSTS